MTKKQYNKKNQRRHELLVKDAVYGISFEEMEELVHITKECTDYIDKKYPMQWDKLEKLSAKLAMAIGEVERIKKEIRKIESLYLPE